MEKRKFERVDLRTEAVVRHRDLTFRGEVENLSLKGLFVRTDQKIPLHEKVDVAMFFHGSSSELSFSLEANVVRATDDGIGLNFRKIDIDSLVRSDVLSSAGDRQQVIEEFYGYAENNDAAEDEKLKNPLAAP
ncbi:PilZ domain-containing protein [Geobacter hydrogenophilus]|uniref:Pilus assembly protein n=1 Tax=Geobacter hydrogenophilus TaxID=40983 RepID=A0A9W6G0J5_9BACT|nr:PilZ domain-containing protein [Geobacter hydrogenophilus]MBT0893879.1 PilZ domain-containing protein [Geobacter hydrogenophilus]GLI38177.1 pilus assembly protein [Geobacter hydrogenophilus]